MQGGTEACRWSSSRCKRSCCRPPCAAAYSLHINRVGWTASPQGHACCDDATNMGAQAPLCNCVLEHLLSTSIAVSRQTICDSLLPSSAENLPYAAQIQKDYASLATALAPASACWRPIAGAISLRLIQSKCIKFPVTTHHASSHLAHGWSKEGQVRAEGQGQSADGVGAISAQGLCGVRQHPEQGV